MVAGQQSVNQITGDDVDGPVPPRLYRTQMHLHVMADLRTKCGKRHVDRPDLGIGCEGPRQPVALLRAAQNMCNGRLRVPPEAFRDILEPDLAGRGTKTGGSA